MLFDHRPFLFEHEEHLSFRICLSIKSTFLSESLWAPFFFVSLWLSLISLYSTSLPPPCSIVLQMSQLYRRMSITDWCGFYFWRRNVSFCAVASSDGKKMMKECFMTIEHRDFQLLSLAVFMTIDHSSFQLQLLAVFMTIDRSSFQLQWLAVFMTVDHRGFRLQCRPFSWW